ncbi:guanine-1-methyltransferase-domain-containing protein [Flagelloscypha sp. PMI_526]|nr:guanine-1-methyltransferase-domain-containing protein [Flagelloscypha sp. PMI_526]
MASATNSISDALTPTILDHIEDSTTLPPSKSALKKARRREHLAASKLEKRAREKEAKKEKKRIRSEKRAAGELDSEEERPKKKLKSLEFGARVVIDLDFDDKMSEKEISSLGSQLTYTYSANRNAGFPFQVLNTSLKGKILARLEFVGDASYKRWSNTEWWSESYEELWNVQPPEGEASTSNLMSRSKASKESIVYLTADSEVELETLSPEETYILGGIVDRNRYKVVPVANLCFDKATEQGIRTARLPIGKYMENLPTRKVLTVNQVFEIMIHWVETRDWEKALYAVMPKRKFEEVGKKASKRAKKKEAGGTLVLNADDVEDNDEEAEGAQEAELEE